MKANFQSTILNDAAYLVIWIQAASRGPWRANVNAANGPADGERWTAAGVFRVAAAY